MKLHITHSTEYRYLSPVFGSSNELRLTPPKNIWQQPQFFLLRILPASRLRRFQDFHQNTVTHFEIEEPHSSLLIESTFTVTTSSYYAQGMPDGVTLATLAETALSEELQPFLQPSRSVEIPPEIWRAAVDVVSGEQEVFATARALMNYVYSTCRYVPKITKVSTTSTEFFTDKRGVCQDFAHLMLALCRAIRLPARYVSGYLYDARRKDIRGAHATHAWVDVWIPGHGWYGLDPTNNCLIQETYVTLAVGRDYQDAAPLTGSYWGSTGCDMDVKVHIEEV
jgi:transglutaminase-like putative cysteine protease